MGVTVTTYLRILRKRWWYLLVPALVGAAVSVTLVLRTTPVYASHVSLFVGTSSNSDATAAYQAGLFSQGRVASYTDLLNGDQVAKLVRDDLGLSIPVSQLRQHLHAQAIPNTVIIDLVATDTGPQRARQIATSAAEQIITMVQDLETPPGTSVPVIKMTMVGSASISTVPVAPTPLRTIPLGVLLGLILGIGAALLRESLDTSIKSTDDLAAVDLISLGVTLRAETDSDVRGDQPSGAPSAEAYRQLRTNLQFIDVDAPPRVVAITSSVAGEGKTTLTINLALALAQAGVRTVVVDADLRRPRLAAYLHLVGGTGLTTVLAGRVKLDTALQTYGRTGVTVLASGQVPPNPSELLGSHLMQHLIEELQQRFDMVLIDCPPLLPVTDAAVLGRLVDGAMIVARHGRTTREQLRRAVDRLEHVDARVLGVVLTAVPAKSQSAYGYGRAYSYGHVDKPSARSTPAGDRSPAPVAPDDGGLPHQVTADGAARHNVGARRNPAPFSRSAGPTAGQTARLPGDQAVPGVAGAAQPPAAESQHVR